MDDRYGGLDRPFHQDFAQIVLEQLNWSLSQSPKAFQPYCLKQVQQLHRIAKNIMVSEQQAEPHQVEQTLPLLEVEASLVVHQ